MAPVGCAWLTLARTPTVLSSTSRPRGLPGWTENTPVLGRCWKEWLVDALRLFQASFTLDFYLFLRARLVQLARFLTAS